MNEVNLNIIEELAVPVKPFPKVGDRLVILHTVKRNDGGIVVGMQRADGKPVAAEITAVYLDGSVRTGNSDHWEVKPSHGHGRNARWETVNPDRP